MRLTGKMSILPRLVTGQSFAWLSLALAALVVVFAVAAPAVTSVRQTAKVTAVSGEGGSAGRFVEEPGTAEVSHRTLLQANGPRILGLMAIPVALAGFPLLARPAWQRAARTLAAGLLFGWVMLTGFSIGLLYIPSLVAMAAAAALPQAPPGERSTGEKE